MLKYVQRRKVVAEATKDSVSIGCAVGDGFRVLCVVVECILVNVIL